MPSICFETKVSKIGSFVILALPKKASAKLPSRGMVFVDGKINGFHFQTPLEPDGKGSHFFKLDKNLLKGAQADVGKDVTLQIEPIKDWPEPKTPLDLKKALAAAPKANNLWMSITPMARFDWIRWIQSTKVAATRQKRVKVACSKLNKGMRRPCCFNRSMCTETAVSKNGVLLEPESVR